MCGIAGVVGRPAAEPAIDAMLTAMAHRGPDGRGAIGFDGGAAGMVRLALVDLSPRGQQPMWTADERTAIVFNGEIYNFRELRAGLERAGHRFRTTTDTEVILALHQAYGGRFVEHLRGMFALAIFEFPAPRRGRPIVTLARDPLGIKPLYVTGDHVRGFAFASEIRALVASGAAAPVVDRDGLRDYLTFGFVLQPRTILDAVRMVEPGTVERYVPDAAPVRTRYWEIPQAVPAGERLEDAAERLRETLERSVALHALADAPVGAFLSGGVDSSAVVALMRPHIADLRTFTVAFPGTDHTDEAARARATAEALGCRSTVAAYGPREVTDLFPRFTAGLDQPSIDGFNTWLVARAAASEVTGVLSGLGGDEAFAGYRVTARMAALGAGARGAVRRAAGHLAHGLAPVAPGHLARRKLATFGARRAPIEVWTQAHRVFEPSEAARLLGDTGHPATAAERVAAAIEARFPEWRSESPVGLSMLLDTTIYMGCQLLRDSDVTSMAHSLELRVPLVDPEVIAFARSCHDDLKIRDGRGKYVLERAVAPVLPPGAGAGPKRGFSLPYRAWLEGPLREAADTGRAVLVDSGLVDGAALGRAPSAFPWGWSIMVLGLWWEAFGSTRAPQPPATAARGRDA